MLWFVAGATTGFLCFFLVATYPFGMGGASRESNKQTNKPGERGSATKHHPTAGHHVTATVFASLPPWLSPIPFHPFHGFQLRNTNLIYLCFSVFLSSHLSTVMSNINPTSPPENESAKMDDRPLNREEYEVLVQGYEEVAARTRFEDMNLYVIPAAFRSNIDILTRPTDIL